MLSFFNHKPNHKRREKAYDETLDKGIDFKPFKTMKGQKTMQKLIVLTIEIAFIISIVFIGKGMYQKLKNDFDTMNYRIESIFKG